MTDEDAPIEGTPLDAALRRENVDLANRALAALPDADRELVVMFYRCDESISDVARTLALPEATTRKRLQRTRERLRDARASVEAMLRATRPGPAFTLACVAALAAGRVVDASAATTSPSMPVSIGTKAVALGGAVLAIVVAIVVARVATTSSSSTTSAAPAIPAIARSAGSSTTPSVAVPPGIRRISRADRAVLLAGIHARRGSGSAIDTRVYDFADVAVATPPPVDDVPAAALTKTTLRRAIARVHPMLRACGDGHGRLAVKLRLDGEARGTLIETVEITGEPPLSDDGDFVECVRTTLESLELPPTNDTVPWEVYYPFVF